MTLPKLILATILCISILFTGCVLPQLPDVRIDPPATRVLDKNHKVKYYIEHTTNGDRLYDKDRKFIGTIE